MQRRMNRRDSRTIGGLKRGLAVFAICSTIYEGMTSQECVLTCGFGLLSNRLPFPITLTIRT